MSKIYHFSSSKRMAETFALFFNHFVLIADLQRNQMNTARKIMSVADKCACFRQNSCGCYCFPLLSYHGGFSINWSRCFLCRCQTTLLLFFSIKIQLGISRTTFLLLPYLAVCTTTLRFYKIFTGLLVQAEENFPWRNLSLCCSSSWKNPHPTMYLCEFENRLVSAGKTKTFSPTMLNLYQVDLDYTNWFCTFS